MDSSNSEGYFAFNASRFHPGALSEVRGYAEAFTQAVNAMNVAQAMVTAGDMDTETLAVTHDTIREAMAEAESWLEKVDQPLALITNIMELMGTTLVLQNLSANIYEIWQMHSCILNLGTNIALRWQQKHGGICMLCGEGWDMHTEGEDHA